MAQCELCQTTSAYISEALGVCVKFDLKAWNNHLHLALTGVENQRTLENFARAAKQVGRRDDPPILVANTLLVPGYIDVEEVAAIARFIASLDPYIPYSLLAFHPQFYMSDLPLTRKNLAERCLRSAREAGLSNVRIGNIQPAGIRVGVMPNQLK